jgi:hypothetical protein
MPALYLQSSISFLLDLVDLLSFRLECSILVSYLFAAAYNNGIFEISFNKKVQPKGKTIEVE